MRPPIKLRVSLILCSILSVALALVGGVAVSAAASRHHHKKAHHKAPKPSGDALPKLRALPAPSLFGINTGVYDNSQANFQRDIPTARSLGTRWVHFTSGSVHFYGNGQPNWTVMDYEVRQARKNGLGVLISLGGTPTACSVSSLRTKNPSACPPRIRDLAAYRSFVRAELVRYHNDVQYWESWVEPNLNGGWAGHPDPGQYANVLRAQWQAFQSFNSTYHADMKLIFGGTISFSTGPGGSSMAVLPFVHDVLSDLGGARVFDAIGLHAYRFPQSNGGPATENWGPSAVDYDYVGGIPYARRANGPYPTQGCNRVFSGYCQMNWRGELSAVEQEFANHGYGQVPLWLTEFGWPGNASPSTALYPSYATQAANLSDAYSVIMSLPFVQAAFWFNLRDYQPGFVSPDPPFFYHFGLLEYGFGQKPAAAAFKSLAAANPGR